MTLNKTATKTIIAALCASIFASGCSTFTTVDKDIERTTAAADGGVKGLKEMAHSGAVTIHKGYRLSGKEVQVKDAQKLPAVFDKPFPYATKVSTAREIVKTISYRSGIPAIVSADAPAALGATAPISASSRPMDIEWTGSLRGLLDHIALTLGEYWKYEDGRIHFFNEETRSFSINLPPGSKTMSASISLSGSSGGSGGGGGGGGSSGAGGNVSVSSTQTVDPFSAIVSGVKAIMSDRSISGRNSDASSGPAMPGITGSVPAGLAGAAGAGGSAPKVVPTPELGMITVTGAPPVLDRVGSYIDSVNKKFSRNIMVDVKVYSLTVSDEAATGANLDINKILYRRMANIGVGLTPAALLQPPSGVTPGQVKVDVIDRKDPAQMGALIAQAMRGIGEVSLVTSGQVMAVNGQPAPMQIANEVNYLASSSTTQLQGAGATTTLTPGQRLVGMTANFTPTIMSDNRILLQYQMNISNMLSLDRVTSGGSMIQTPNIANQTLQQQAFLNDGQSLVLFGYEQTRSARDANGDIGAFSKTASKSRQMTVIVMQVLSGGLN